MIYGRLALITNAGGKEMKFDECGEDEHWNVRILPEKGQIQFTDEAILLAHEWGAITGAPNDQAAVEAMAGFIEEQYAENQNGLKPSAASQKTPPEH